MRPEFAWHVATIDRLVAEKAAAERDLTALSVIAYLMVPFAAVGAGQFFRAVLG